MNDFYQAFSTSSKSEWISILEKELKGESIDVLQKHSLVEDISFNSYTHHEDLNEHFSDPGQYPFTRGNNAANNDWHIATTFKINQEKEVNASIHKALMSGTNQLILETVNENPINFDVLFAGIGLSFIKTTFRANTIEQTESFLKFAKGAPVSIVLKNQQELLEKLTDHLSASRHLFHVNASSVQQAGANTWQEVAYALAEGHELLVRLLDLGIDCDTAASSIHFTFGIGNKFYFEAAKFRAFRTVWAQLVNAYNPKNQSSCVANITAQTSFIHISLKDPYTNLLRQTTEAMSAVIGGVDSLNILPYDWYATKQNLVFSQRMATNISLLLKEESYLNIVIDPAGGSYAIDSLTTEIANKSWQLFKLLEEKSGINNADAIALLRSEIEQKAALRIQQVTDKKEKLIGITLFPNPEKIDNSWLQLPTCWNGLKPLIIEQAI